MIGLKRQEKVKEKSMMDRLESKSQRRNLTFVAIGFLREPFLTLTCTAFRTCLLSFENIVVAAAVTNGFGQNGRCTGQAIRQKVY